MNEYWLKNEEVDKEIRNLRKEFQKIFSRIHENQREKDLVEAFEKISKEFQNLLDLL
jgi:hypothetical protein